MVGLLGFDEQAGAAAARAWRPKLATKSCASTVDGLAEAGAGSIAVVPLLGRSGGVVGDVPEDLPPIVGDRGA